MSNILNVGDIFFAYIVIRDVEGDQTASNDIAYALRPPSGTASSDAPAQATSDDLDAINLDNVRNPDWEVLTSNVGVYVANIELTEAGSWWLRWSATDPVQLAQQEAFYVYPQRVP